MHTLRSRPAAGPVDQDRADALRAFRTLFDLLSVGVILLDSSLNPVEVNARAQSILLERDGLLVWNGRLRATFPVDTRELQRRVASVLEGGGPGASARPPPSRALQALALRLPGTEPPLAALIVTDPGIDRAPAVPECVQQLFGLTEAETRVAVALARGATPPEIARAMGVQGNTVRWHLKNIYTKAGAHSQSDLVRLLLTAPTGPLAGFNGLPAHGHRSR